jgi:AcrR family transcriptional regulator
VLLRWRFGWRDGWSGVKTVISRPNLLAGENLPPAPQQKRSVQKLARLKSAGLPLFGENGYEKTSINQIAERANLAVGGFYQHFRSKRQLLLALMDDLLQGLSQLDLQPKAFVDVRKGIHESLAQAFSRDLQYLGAYRAWREASLSDPGLAQKQREIQEWTSTRVRAVFEHLQKMHTARAGVDISTLARVMDSFFWNLLAQAQQMPGKELEQWIDSSTHLIFHALFTDKHTASAK